MRFKGDQWSAEQSRPTDPFDRSQPQANLTIPKMADPPGRPPQQELKKILQNDMDQFEQFLKKYDRINSGLLQVPKTDDLIEERDMEDSVRPSTIDLVRTEAEFDSQVRMQPEDNNLELPNESQYLPIAVGEIGQSHYDIEDMENSKAHENDMIRPQMSIDKPLFNSSAYVNIEGEEALHSAPKSHLLDEEQLEGMENDIDWNVSYKPSMNNDSRLFNPEGLPSSNTIQPSLRYSVDKSLAMMINRKPNEFQMPGEQAGSGNFETEQPMNQRVTPNELPHRDNVSKAQQSPGGPVVNFDEVAIKPRTQDFNEQLKNALQKDGKSTANYDLQFDTQIDQQLPRREQNSSRPNTSRFGSKKQSDPEFNESTSQNTSRYQSMRGSGNQESVQERKSRNASSQDKVGVIRNDSQNRIEKRDSLAEFKQLEEAAGSALGTKKREEKERERPVSRNKRPFAKANKTSSSNQLHEAPEVQAAAVTYSETEQQLRALLAVKLRIAMKSEIPVFDEKLMSLLLDLSEQLKQEILEELGKSQENGSAALVQKITLLEIEKANLIAELSSKVSKPAPIEPVAEDSEKQQPPQPDKKPDTLMLKSKRVFEEENELLKKRIRKMEEEFKAKEQKSKDASDELAKKIKNLEQELKDRDKANVSHQRERNVSPLKSKTKTQNSGLNQTSGPGLQLQTVGHNSCAKDGEQLAGSVDRKATDTSKVKTGKTPSKQESSAKGSFSNQDKQDEEQHSKKESLATNALAQQTKGEVDKSSADLSKNSLQHSVEGQTTVDKKESLDKPKSVDLSTSYGDLKKSIDDEKSDTGSTNQQQKQQQYIKAESSAGLPVANSTADPRNSLRKSADKSAQSLQSFGQNSATLTGNKTEKKTEGKIEQKPSTVSVNSRQASRSKVIGSKQEIPALALAKEGVSTDGQSSVRSVPGGPKKPAISKRENTTQSGQKKPIDSKTNALSNASQQAKPVQRAKPLEIRDANPQDRQLLSTICRSFNNPFPGVKNRTANFSVDSYAYTNNKYYQDYLAWKSANRKVVKTAQDNPERTQLFYEDNVQEIVFSTGARRVIFPNQYILVMFQNNDVKQTFPDKTIVYHYAEHNTTQMTMADKKVEVR